MKRLGRGARVVLGVCLGALCFGGCGRLDTDEREALEFAVMGKELLPREVLEKIESKGSESFSFTYGDGEFLYIAVGYGAQKGDGYSIAVESCDKGEQAIYVDTTLLGPEAPQAKTEGISYPYIVLRTEYFDLPVMTE